MRMDPMSQSPNAVGYFFDALTTDYTETIERCFPRYREMLWALLDYLPSNQPVNSILELGCGTGNLSVLLREQFPNARLRLVDISAESIATCKTRFPPSANVEFEECAFQSIDYADESFDLIISNISIHHLRGSEKQKLFRQCYRWLVPGGVFSFADQFAGETDEIYQKHIGHWRSLSFEAGSTDAEWEMWMQHQRDHDHHDTLPSQLAWIVDAGFVNVDCVWRFLLWSVVQARK